MIDSRKLTFKFFSGREVGVLVGRWGGEKTRQENFSSCEGRGTGTEAHRTT